MTPLWDIKDLKPPPNLTYEMQPHRINATELISICSSAISVLNKQEALHIEAATLSRLLYRIKSRLRCDKGFKFLTKVNRGLLRYLAMDLASVYNTFKPSAPDSGYQTMCAPSKQMLEWLLVRIQGFAQLFCQVIQSCEHAAFYMKCRLHLGHVWDIALISLGLVSRIWAISRYLVLCACEWYKQLKPFLNILSPVGIPWLPAGYHFPENLKKWLDAPLLIDPLAPRSDTGKRKQPSIFDLIDVDNSENEMEPTEYNQNMSSALNIPSQLLGSDEKTSRKQAQHIHQSEQDSEEKNINSNLISSTSAKNFTYQVEEDIGEPVSSSSLSPWSPSYPPQTHHEHMKLKTKRKDVRLTMRQNKIMNLKQKQTGSWENEYNDIMKIENKHEDVVSFIEKEEAAMKSKKKRINIVKVDDKLNYKINAEKKCESKAKLGTKPKGIQKSKSKEKPIVKLKNKQKGGIIKFEDNREDVVNFEKVSESVVKFEDKQRNRRQSKCLIESIRTIETAEDLRKFLCKEEKRRKKRSDLSLTRELDKLQWHMLYKSLSDVLEKLGSKHVIEGSYKYKKMMKKAKKEIWVRTRS